MQFQNQMNDSASLYGASKGWAFCALCQQCIYS